MFLFGGKKEKKEESRISNVSNTSDDEWLIVGKGPASESPSERSSVASEPADLNDVNDVIAFKEDDEIPFLENSLDDIVAKLRAYSWPSLHILENSVYSQTRDEASEKLRPFEIKLICSFIAVVMMIIAPAVAYWFDFKEKPKYRPRRMLLNFSTKNVNLASFSDFKEDIQLFDVNDESTCRRKSFLETNSKYFLRMLEENQKMKLAFRARKRAIDYSLVPLDVPTTQPFECCGLNKLLSCHHFQAENLFNHTLHIDEEVIASTTTTPFPVHLFRYAPTCSEDSAPLVEFGPKRQLLKSSPLFRYAPTCAEDSAPLVQFGPKRQLLKSSPLFRYAPTCSEDFVPRVQFGPKRQLLKSSPLFRLSTCSRRRSFATTKTFSSFVLVPRRSLVRPVREMFHKDRTTTGTSSFGPLLPAPEAQSVKNKKAPTITKLTPTYYPFVRREPACYAKPIGPNRPRGVKPHIPTNVTAAYNPFVRREPACYGKPIGPNRPAVRTTSTALALVTAGTSARKVIKPLTFLPKRSRNVNDITFNKTLRPTTPAVKKCLRQDDVIGVLVKFFKKEMNLKEENEILVRKLRRAERMVRKLESELSYEQKRCAVQEYICKQTVMNKAKQYARRLAIQPSFDEIDQLALRAQQAVAFKCQSAIRFALDESKDIIASNWQKSQLLIEKDVCEFTSKKMEQKHSEEILGLKMEHSQEIANLKAEFEWEVERLFKTKPFTTL